MNFWWNFVIINWTTLSFCGAEKIRSASGAAKYALGSGPTKGTKDDYYQKSENVGHDGKWRDPSGMLLEFGIKDGDIIKYEDLLNLLEGKNPLNGEYLSSKFKDGHMAGTELDMSAPKSVSAIWAIASEELKAEIDRAIMEANEDALKFVQENAIYTRQGKAGVNHVKSDSITATFNHGTSRGAANEQGGDPHRHLHNLIPNLTKVNSEWRTLENSYLFEYQKAFGAQFRASLAIKLQALGFPTEQTNDGAFKIPGVPDDLVKHWSSRREQMIEKAKEDGKDIHNQNDMRKLQQSTRRSKIVKLIGDLVDRWTGEAKDYGFDAEAVKALTETKQAKLSKEEQADAVKTQVAEAMAELVDTESVFTRAHMITKLSEKLTGVIDHEAIIKEVHEAIKNDDIVHLGRPDGATGRKEYMSTKLQIAIEAAIPEMAKKLFTSGEHEIAHKIIDSVIAKKGGISEEQEAAVRHAVSDGSLKIIVGDAGVGKTFSSSAVNDIFKLAGKDVQAIAPTWKAAKGLQDELDIEGHVKAIQGFINSVNAGKTKIDANSVILIDEAGMMGARTTHALLEIAEKTGCKLVLMGDHKQLNAIEAGSGMKIILDNLESARISTIRRQNSAEDREMVTNLAAGDVGKAIKSLDERGGIQYEQGEAKVFKSLINDWSKSTLELGWTPETATDPDKSHLIIAVKNSDVLILNDMVRQVLRERGLYGGEDFEIKCQPITSNGDAEHLKFAVGDRIILRKNEQKDLEVTNRDEGLITRIEFAANGGYDFHLKMNNGEQKVVNTKTYVDDKTKSFAATHGYCYSTYSSQGMTQRRVFAVAEGMGARYSYVSLSRHKESVRLYANAQSLRYQVADRESIKPNVVTKNDIKSQLILQLSRKSDKLSTLDFAACKVKKPSVAEVKMEIISKSVTRVQAKVVSSLESMKKSAKRISDFILGGDDKGKTKIKPLAEMIKDLQESQNRIREREKVTAK